MGGQGRCWFCGERRQALTDEHILSAHHFGAELVSSKAVCAECNSAAGEVEGLVAGGPWVSEAIGRFRAGPSAPRARVYPWVQGRTTDDATVWAEERPGGLKIVALVPRMIGTEGEGIEVWEVEAGTEAEYEARQLRKGRKVRTVGRELDSFKIAETQRDIGDKTFDAWGRFVSKVVLATASLLLPPSWLDGDDAVRLRAFFLRRPHPGPGMPFHAAEQDLSQEPWSLLHGTHLISLHRPPGGEGCRFAMALFGYLGAEVALLETDCPSDEPSWLIPSDVRTPVQVAGTELDQAIRNRAWQGGPG